MTTRDRPNGYFARYVLGWRRVGYHDADPQLRGVPPGSDALEVVPDYCGDPAAARAVVESGRNLSDSVLKSKRHLSQGTLAALQAALRIVRELGSTPAPVACRPQPAER